MMDNEDTSLILFKAISNFTSDLGEEFSEKHHQLKLYNRLIKKTTIVHDNAIKKHINAFRDFCVSNRDAIVTKNIKELKIKKISYSQRVYIDISFLLEQSDKETSDMIWKHLLYLSAILDTSGKAKEILRKNLEEGKTGSGETNFLTDIIDKVEKHVDPNSNPMEAVSSIMNSGVFTDLVGGMNSGLSDGSLDLGKLMGAVQGMVGQLGDKTNGDPQADGAMNMLNTMIGGMGGLGGDKKSGNGGDMPDLAGLMKGMMGGLGGLGGDNTGSAPDLTGLIKGMTGGLDASKNIEK